MGSLKKTLCQQTFKTKDLLEFSGKTYAMYVTGFFEDSIILRVKCSHFCSSIYLSLMLEFSIIFKEILLFVGTSVHMLFVVPCKVQIKSNCQNFPGWLRATDKV